LKSRNSLRQTSTSIKGKPTPLPPPEAKSTVSLRNGGSLKTEEELRIEAMDDEMRERKRIEEKLLAIQIKARKLKVS
jgi:hypothetical protein